jgi:hypothetical protein
MILENDKAKLAFEEVDIFKTGAADSVLWRGSSASLDAATAHINELLVSDPGEYFAHIHPTGQKLFFKPNGHNGTK